ncbi:MAG: SDR family NAD(P)-dependent oxidoreductase [Actinobacteria bacterium]|nr:SDR family NAD(P)-dependent oxidoreductase [Actinomycetota bacterium]
MKKPPFQLDGAVCLVTGASSGIGRTTAHRLAGAGARLVLQGRNEEELARVATETGGEPVAMDLAVPEAAEALIAQAKRLVGRVDVLVNNAGAGWEGPVSEMPLELVQSLVALNLLTPIALARMALPEMIAAGRGRIVFVASIAGYLGVRREAVYSATKAAILAFAESLRAETLRTGVAISVVSPGVVDTAFFSRRGSPYERSWPRPIAPDLVSKAICRAIEEGRPETIVPRGLRTAVRIKALAPSVYRALADRFA